MPRRRERANAIRALSMDAVQKANSGHPGAPMGMADIAEVLWRDYLKHNPSNPSFADRDRFVLSNGHGSMLIYSLLHLTGYDLSIDDLKNFRQLHSRTPGHPELGYTPGVETTTGPLGQGLANAVGFALAEKVMEHREVASLPRISCVTGNLGIKFIKPTPMGVPLTLRARVEGDVGRKTRILCEVYAGDVLTALGDSIFVRVDTGQLATAAHGREAG